MDNGKTIGYLTKWRLVFASRYVIKQLSRMLGSNASLFVGNNDGKLWYNLSFIVPSPPVNMPKGNGIVEYSRKGMPVLAEARNIQNTEWLILVELSKNKILSSSNEYLNGILTIGFLSILIGFILTILMSRSITGPLSLLTKASENIAAGDYSSQVKIKQQDELGNLANSFNFMQKKINETQNHLKNSLNEKEILLKEIHHRVKNNLQIISSLLNLQTTFLKETESIQAIESSRNRIKSMAIVHEKLYQTEDFVQINFEDYIQELVRNLDNSYQAEVNNLTYKIETEQIFINIDTATSLGLIITELISNSVKHAFCKDRGDNEIVIKGYFINDNCYKLIFSDNGCGLPQNYDIDDSDSLGLQLVTGLVKQIKGTIEVGNSPGTSFEITFLINEKIIAHAEVGQSIY
jgi:two-component sensor histidine kinase